MKKKGIIKIKIHVRKHQVLLTKVRGISEKENRILDKNTIKEMVKTFPNLI